MLFAALVLGASPSLAPLRACQERACAQVRLADVAATDGVQSGELVLVARRDGTLIAWAEGEGARLALAVLDSAADELASDVPALAADPARVEIAARAGETYVIQWEAREASNAAWMCATASIAHEDDATRAAPGRASAALQAAHELEATDTDGARALLEAAVCEIVSLPGARDSRAAADALVSLMFPAFACGALDSALAAARGATEIRASQEPPDSKLVQSPRIGASNVLNELGRNEEALALGLEIEARYARRLSADDPELAKVRLNLANAMRFAGELERPAKLIGDALAVYECVLPPESAERQRAGGIAAELDLALGRPEQAAARLRELYLQALSSGDPNILQTTGGNYAIALSECAELELARQIEEENLARAERRLPASHPVLIRLRENLAVTLLCLGDLPRARTLLELALAPYAEHSTDRPDEMRVLANLAELEQRSGNLPRARELFERAAAIGATLEDKSAASLPLNGLAQAMLAAGESAEAQRLLEQVVVQRVQGFGDANVYTQTARMALAECLSFRGEHARALEQSELARQRLEASFSADDDHVLTARLLELGIRARAGESSRVSALLRTWDADLARRFARESSSASPRFVEERAWSWRKQIAAALQLALASPDEAELADASLALLETSRASSLWAAEALRLAGASDKARDARAVISRLSRELARLSSAPAPDAAQLARVTAAKDEAERRLLADLAATPAGTAWGEPVSIDAIRAALSPDEGALSFTMIEGASESNANGGRILAFVLRPRRPAKAFDLASRAELEQAVLAWREALGTEGRPALAPSLQRATGEALRRLVLDPLRAEISGVKRLFVVLDGALHLVPLDSLPDGERFVGDGVELLTVPTLAVLARTKPPKETARALVVIGGLDYGDGALRPLAATGLEAERVAQLYRASDREVRVLGGRDVDRETFAAELARAGILHIATHGELSPARGEPVDEGVRGGGFASWSPTESVRELSPLALCGLALSNANRAEPDGERAGFVRGVELAGMDASRCELVVLSACETRAGVLRPGLAVASLEKALHLAGARAVVASLWKVDDAQSLELMLEFHRAMVERALPPAAALWSAKSALRARRLPLRAWAGWVLSRTDVGERE